MSDNVTLTIDGREISVPKGTLVIRAAEQLGIYIPRFCDHPLLDPLGACRQCLVEIEGQRKPLTACTTTVSDGMVVRTQYGSELARDAQEGMLEFLLINHPLDCPMCDKGGECPLQDQALAYGPGGSRYVDVKRRFTKPVPINPLVRLDRERCVLCARCTRFADQISGTPFIELFERSALEQVAIFEDEPYRDVFSGNVIQICPVGALTSQTFRFLARPFDMTTTASTCTRCASGCSVDLQERRGQIVRVLAKRNDEVNDEWLCDKGRFGYAYTMSPERVAEPLVRKGDDFVAVSWSEAVELVASRIGEARDGGRRTGVLAGSNLLAEDAYALSRFARVVLGTNDVEARGFAATDEEEHVLGALLRAGGATNDDIDRARVIVIAGIDLREESPIVFLRVRKAARGGDVRVVEIGPRRTLARAGAVWLPCAPGREAEVLARLGDAGGDGSSDAGAQIAAAIAEAGGSVVVLAGERLASSPGALSLAWNLSVSARGRFGWIPRGSGGRAALEAGLHPAFLPGGRSVRWEPVRAQVEEVWGTAVPAKAGSGATAVYGDAASYGFMLLVGADPVADALDRRAAARALDAAPFVVALDEFITESSRRADVVLPVASHYERSGTALNWEGRGQHVAGVIPPAGLSLPDHEILAMIAEARGVSFPRTVNQLRAEMRRLEPSRAEAEAVPAPPLDDARASGTVLASLPALLDAGTMMTGADELAMSREPAVVEIHPDDAAGIATGDAVRVSVAGSTVTLPARVSADVARGVVAIRRGEALPLLGDDPFPVVEVTRA